MKIATWNGPVLDVRCDNDKVFTLGTWWWDTDLLRRRNDQIGVTAEELLGMLVANKVSEIYLDIHFDQLADWDAPDKARLSKSDVADFIGVCGSHGIRVAALTGEGGKRANPWLDPARGYPEFSAHIQATAAFNREAAPDQRFYGVHLDMEPDCGEERPKFLKWMYWMLKNLRSQCDAAGLRLEFDLNSWYNAGDMTTDDDGAPMNIMEAYTTLCDGLSIMSYRPEAMVQKAMSKFMFDMAAKNRCHISLSSETMAPEDLGEESAISYYQKGAAYFVTQQRELRCLMEATGYTNVGLSIHWANAWYHLVTTTR